MKSAAVVTIFALVVSACAETTVQPMARDRFKVSTNAAQACGPAGARNLAFKAAAIEVVRKGGDKFVIENDSTDTGLQGDIFNGFYQNFAQGMVVRMIPDGSREAGNALSAREVLGGDWQNVVAKGVPNTCA